MLDIEDKSTLIKYTAVLNYFYSLGVVVSREEYQTMIGFILEGSTRCNFGSTSRQCIDEVN